MRSTAIAEQTAPTNVDALVVTTAAGRVIELAGHEDGGVARAGDAVVAFARMEFSLITALLERRRRAGDPERAYMAWGELAGSLEFKGTGPADSDNVRELVRRVRRKLSTAGLDDLIGSRQGIGYRLNGTPHD
jgi:DNA-binding response OmpR family regulator